MKSRQVVLLISNLNDVSLVHVETLTWHLAYINKNVYENDTYYQSKIKYLFNVAK
jgi:hypothetical protein